MPREWKACTNDTTCSTCPPQTRQYELLKAIRRQLLELLQEMCRRKSFEAAIEEPLFLTWSLSKFGAYSLLDGRLPYSRLTSACPPDQSKASVPSSSYTLTRIIRTVTFLQLRKERR